MATDFKDFLSGLTCSPVLDLVEENKTAIVDFTGSRPKVSYKDKNKIVFQPVSFMCFYPGDCGEKENIRSNIKADCDAFIFTILNIANDLFNRDIGLIAKLLDFEYDRSPSQYKVFFPTDPTTKLISSAILDRDYNKGILTISVLLSINLDIMNKSLFFDGNLDIKILGPK